MTMKVQELIMRLRQFDPDLEVEVEDAAGNEYELLEVVEYDEENEHCIVLHTSLPTS